MRIAYLVNRYPAISHSFIRREIEALERHGAEIERFSIRDPGTVFPDVADTAERAITTVVLSAGLMRIGTAVCRMFFCHPAKLYTAARLSVRMTPRGRGAVIRSMAYVAEACWLVGESRRRGIEHFHAHFGTNPTAVVRLVHRLGGPAYGFTVHGPDEFDAPEALDLEGKIAEAKHVFAISSYGRSQLMRWSNPDHWAKIGIARCGVDPSYIAEQRAVVRHDRLCCVARLSRQKGLPVLIDAVKILADRGQDVRIDVIGDGELRPALAERIYAEKLGEHIKLLGAKSGHDVRLALASSRGMVLPSFAEGLPVVIMEALAVRTPVIVTAIAGIPELVDANCGWVVPPGSAERLADAIAELIAASEPDLLKKGGCGRTRVLQQHDAMINGAAMLARLAEPSC